MRNIDALFHAFVKKRVTSARMTIREREAVHLLVLQQALTMPLFEFKCDRCGQVVEKLFASFAAMQAQAPAECGARGPFAVRCDGTMQRQASAPGVIDIRGFSHVNGYASPRTIRQRHGSVKTTVSGNFEAFSDGLVK